MNREKKIAKAAADAVRQSKKDCTPTDNYGERYVTGTEKLRTQGKGDRCRDPEWYSDEITARLRKIYGKEEKEKEANEADTEE